MSLVENEMFLYNFLDNLNLGFVSENNDIDFPTKLDKHLEKIKKAKQILSEKIERTPKESSEYLKKQLELLNSRENKLTKHNENLKSEHIKNFLYNNLIGDKSDTEYDPENENHQKLIKSYHKKNMENVRNHKTDSILKSIFDDDDNDDSEGVSEMVQSPQSRQIELDKIKARLMLATNKDDEKEKNNIFKVAMQNLRLQKERSKENAELNKLKMHRMTKIK